MYALYGHQFSRAFGRYVMAILALVFTLTSFVCSANGDVPRANYQSVQNPQSNDQMYFAETYDGASVESVLSPSHMPLAEPIAEGETESSSIQHVPTETFQTETFQTEAVSYTHLRAHET